MEPTRTTSGSDASVSRTLGAHNGWNAGVVGSAATCSETAAPAAPIPIGATDAAITAATRTRRSDKVIPRGSTRSGAGLSTGFPDRAERDQIWSLATTARPGLLTAGLQILDVLRGHGLAADAPLATA